MDIFLFVIIMGCTSLLVYGIVEVRKDIEKLKKIIEENSKLPK